MRILIIIFFVAFLCHTGNSQKIIKGKVCDEHNNPLIGASVYLVQQNKGTITDIDGQFVVADVPAGSVIVQVSFIGYQNHIETVATTDSSTTLMVKMVQAPIKAQEVVVSGSFNNSQHENAIKVDILNLTDVSNMDTPNFMELITRVPGVDMIANGNSVSKPVIRGLSMSNILALNNGVRIENYQYSEHHPLGIDEHAIEKIEIIKGASSLLYGSDAIGGVLNFITEKPAPVGKIIGNYSLKLNSNTMGVNTGFGIKGATKNVFAGLQIGTKSHSDYVMPNACFVKNSRFNEKSIHANIGLTKNYGTFKLFYNYFKQDLGMTVPPAIAAIETRNRKNNIWYQDLTHQLIASQNKLFFGAATLEINTSYQNAYRKLNTNLEMPFVEMSLNTFSYETKLLLHSNKKSEYSLGIQGYYQTNTNKNNRASQFLPNADINSNSVFGMLQYTFFKSLKLQSGIRIDNYWIKTKALGVEQTSAYHSPVENRYNSINGSLGFTYNIRKTDFRFNVAKAFRSPNIAELTSNGVHESRFEKGNTNLKPQDSYETDISMHYHADNITFDVAAFYNYIHNYIFLNPTGEDYETDIPIYVFSQTSANLYGFESGLHIHPKYFEWLHVELTYSTTTAKDDFGAYLPFIPANKMRSELRFEKKTLLFFNKPYFRANMLSAFAMNRPAANETNTEGYNVLDVGIGGSIKVYNQLINTSISVSNVFNKEYFDHLSTLKEMNIYNQGRSINFSLKIPFSVL